MSDYTLLPCPFCGATPKAEEGVVAFIDWQISCGHCGTCGPNFNEHEGSVAKQADNTVASEANRVAAYHAWNTRAPVCQREISLTEQKSAATAAFQRLPSDLAELLNYGSPMNAEMINKLAATWIQKSLPMRETSTQLRSDIEQLISWAEETGQTMLRSRLQSILMRMQKVATGEEIAAEDAAQRCRQYLKNQNFPASWNALDDYQKGVTVACMNLEELLSASPEKFTGIEVEASDAKA